VTILFTHEPDDRRVTLAERTFVALTRDGKVAAIGLCEPSSWHAQLVSERFGVSPALLKPFVDAAGDPRVVRVVHDVSNGAVGIAVREGAVRAQRYLDDGSVLNVDADGNVVAVLVLVPAAWQPVRAAARTGVAVEVLEAVLRRHLDLLEEVSR
jgi:uncharacterized protein YuzE